MAELRLEPQLMIGQPWADYGLIDSGHGRKLVASCGSSF